jgi:predicted transcriptional regulator
MRDLAKIRVQLGISQIELAEIIGVSDSQISSIEHGQGQLTLAQYGMMMKALRLTHEMQNQLIEEAIANAKPQRIRRKKARE